MGKAIANEIAETPARWEKNAAAKQIQEASVATAAKFVPLPDSDAGITAPDAVGPGGGLSGE